MVKPSLYFPNLNGLRFIAAFLVIIHHAEQIKSFFKIDNYWNSVPAIFLVGKLGVVLFFVLSGFLITCLLLTEEATYKKISVKKFYMRRVLRIWPLYFLIVIVALWVMPNISSLIIPGFEKNIVYENINLKVILFALFLPNLVLGLFGPVPYAQQTWSIGSEEQFYLFWPLIFKYLKKYRVVIVLAVIGIYLGTLKLLQHSSYFSAFSFHKIILIYWSSFNLDFMAIGGLFALLLFQKSKYLTILLNKYLFYISLLTAMVLIVNGVSIPRLDNEFYAVVFGIIILNFSANKSIGITLEYPWLNYLGKISYGLYMYHQIAIVICLYFLRKFNIVTNWLLYPSTLILTVAMAGLSHRYFESFFLQFKSSFSKIDLGKQPKKVKPVI